MTPRLVVLAAAAWLAAVSTTVAQPKEPIGRFAADVRAASAGLPVLEGWTPFVPEGTQLPSRTLGLEAGAHLYVARLRLGTLGVGASWLLGRGTTSPPPPPEGTTVAPEATNPTVTTRLTSLSPQVSLNFGHSLGWSYLSAGYGRAKVESEATAAPGSSLTVTPVSSGWVSDINYGGGARWFITDRVGVGFDLRWHRLGSFAGPNNVAGGMGTAVFVAAAGLTVK